MVLTGDWRFSVLFCALPLKRRSLQSVRDGLALLEGRYRALVCATQVAGRRVTCLHVGAFALPF